jgi:hypothetical protein
MKKRFIHFSFLFAILFLLISAKTQIFAQPSQVLFQLISEENLKPIPNRDIYVFNGDYKLKHGPGFNPYPYDYSARMNEWYITTVKTDDEGEFLFDINSTKAREIIFQSGPPYCIMHIEKSSDISHSQSDSHIRIIRFEKGQTKVKCNDIYDLKNNVVKKIWLDGRIEEKPFKNVVLIAQKE